MTTVRTSEIVSVWTDNGVPTRLVWNGTRYLVTDTPTALRDQFDDAALTHPLERLVGWRLQGRSVTDGDTRVFDVRKLSGTRWELTGVYA